jgi:16S rRNA (cytosine1402-N4)-methyltransferase
MTQLHVPVLAGELIDVLDPQPGAVAVDCTFGSGGHARLVAERIGADGELICIDRDPHAAEEFGPFAAEAACTTRFERGDYADILPALAA